MAYRRRRNNRPRPIYVRFRCYCSGCGGALPVGTPAYYVPADRAVYGDACCTKGREVQEQNHQGEDSWIDQHLEEAYNRKGRAY